MKAYTGGRDIAYYKCPQCKKFIPANSFVYISVRKGNYVGGRISPTKMLLKICESCYVDVLERLEISEK